MRRFLPIAAACLIACVVAHAQTSDLPLKSQLDALGKTMEAAPPDQRLAWNALYVAFDDFLEAHLRHEICRSSAGCATLQATDRDVLMRNFLLAARGFSPDPIPSYSDDDLLSSDADLNKVYDDIFSSLPAACANSDPACLSQPTFRDVQRDWIRYRDALVTFGTLRWPKIAADTWLTHLTRLRTQQLRAAFPVRPKQPLS